MKRIYAHSWITIAAVALFTCRAVQAIPPPWTIEEMKAKADLVVIAKMATVEPVTDIRGFNRKIRIVPLEVLKGQIAEERHEKGTSRKLDLLFAKREKPKGKIVPVVVGGLGKPEPKTEETALVFLKKRAKEGLCTVVAGKFGYLSMGTGAGEELAAFKKRIGLYQGWCKRIEDEKNRHAMEAYYQKALDFSAKQGERGSKPP